MIAIVNVSPDDASETGLNDYEVRINRKLIARFQHVRSEGLAVCLRKAADAVDHALQVQRINDIAALVNYRLDKPQ